MQELNENLIEQLKDGIVGISEERIMQLIHEAREEALADVKVTLKTHFYQAILEKAAENLVGAVNMAP